MLVSYISAHAPNLRKISFKKLFTPHLLALLSPPRPLKGAGLKTGWGCREQFFLKRLFTWTLVELPSRPLQTKARN
jgi:hypothetical protein